MRTDQYDYGWACVRSWDDYLGEVHRTRSEAITAITHVFSAEAEDPAGRRRQWRRMRREGWDVVRVVTHTVAREAAVTSALSWAEVAIKKALAGDPSDLRKALARVRRVDSPEGAAS